MSQFVACDICAATILDKSFALNTGQIACEVCAKQSDSRITSVNHNPRSDPEFLRFRADINKEEAEQ